MKLIFSLMIAVGIVGFALGMIVNIGQMHWIAAAWVSGKFFATTGAALGGLLGYYLQK